MRTTPDSSTKNEYPDAPSCMIDVPARTSLTSSQDAMRARSSSLTPSKRGTSASLSGVGCMSLRLLSDPERRGHVAQPFVARSDHRPGIDGKEAGRRAGHDDVAGSHALTTAQPV